MNFISVEKGHSNSDFALVLGMNINHIVYREEKKKRFDRSLWAKEKGNNQEQRKMSFLKATGLRNITPVL